MRMLSPSQFHRVMTKGRGSKFGKTAESYAEEIVLQMMGVELDDYTNYAMQWGIDNEPFAIEAYERKTLTMVEQKKRITHSEHKFITGEPDGLVGKHGIIEVKCPNSANHFKNLETGEQIDNYKYQIQGYLWLTGRKWCDFISYDPRFPEKYQLAIHRVERDDEMIDELSARCLDFWKELIEPLLKKYEVDQMEVV